MLELESRLRSGSLKAIANSTIDRIQSGFTLRSTATSLPLRRYRADIDGLRALAVLAVVLFHAGIRGFGGGYAGVDMFFVISGYLITNIISTDLNGEGFTFLRFYERRVRRILPALYAVIVTTGVLSIVYFVPQDLEDFSRSAIATATFLSNIFFWNGTGYFAAADQTRPLLHTWSLAVEEQFYILYPPLLVACRARPRIFLVRILVLTMALSFVLYAWGTAHQWTAAFFLSPSRAWELLLGCLLSLAPEGISISRPARESLALAGITAIALPILTLSSDPPFAVAVVALPCVGVAALIFANSEMQTIVGRALSVRPLVWFGLISYSLYLWHWPILVFARQELLRPLTPIEAWTLIALSVVAGAISWKFIEKPFRGPKGALTRSSLFIAAGTTTFLLIAVALAGDLSGGFPQRFSADIDAMLAYEHYETSVVYRTGTCFVQSPAEYDAGKCFRPTPGRRSILIWGDSHAAHYFYGMEVLGRKRHFALSEAALTGCVPLVGSVSFDSHQCDSFKQSVLELLDRNRPDTVVLSGHWNKYRQRNFSALLSDLDETVTLLLTRHVHLVIIGPGLEFSDRLPLLITRKWAKHGRTPLNLADDLVPGLFDLDRTLGARLSHRSGVTYVSVLSSICPGANCQVLVDGGTPIVWDTAHLTAAGSLYVVQHAFADVK